MCSKTGVTGRERSRMWDALFKCEHGTTTNPLNGLKGQHAMAWNPVLLSERKLAPSVSDKARYSAVFFWLKIK